MHFCFIYFYFFYIFNWFDWEKKKRYWPIHPDVNHELQAKLIVWYMTDENTDLRVMGQC